MEIPYLLECQALGTAPNRAIDFSHTSQILLLSGEGNDLASPYEWGWSSFPLPSCTVIAIREDSSKVLASMQCLTVLHLTANDRRVQASTWHRGKGGWVCGCWTESGRRTLRSEEQRIVLTQDRCVNARGGGQKTQLSALKGLENRSGVYIETQVLWMEPEEAWFYPGLGYCLLGVRWDCWGVLPSSYFV